MNDRLGFSRAFFVGDGRLSSVQDDPETFKQIVEKGMTGIRCTTRFAFGSLSRLNQSSEKERTEGALTTTQF